MPMRPKNVVRFEVLAWLAWGLAIASAALDWATISGYWLQEELGYRVIYVFELLLVFGVQAAWIWLIARGQQNWARWAGLVAAIAAVPLLVLDAGTRFRADALGASAYYVLAVLWAAAMALLFTGDAPEWFKR